MRGCTQCGECLAVCPVFRLLGREEYAPKAKRLLLEAEVPRSGINDASLRPLPWKDLFALSRLCAGCGRCRDACARGLSVPDLLAECRAAHPHWSQVFWDLWMRRAGRFWPLAGRMASLLPQPLVPESLRASQAAAAAMLARPSEPWLKLAPHEPLSTPRAEVLLFTGCTGRNVRPAWGQTAQALLGAWGYTMADDAALTCCGDTLHHAGASRAQALVRRQNVAAWRTAGRPLLVTVCASCRQALMGYTAAPGLLEPAEIERWQVRSLASLLTNPQVMWLAAAPATAPAWHQPCHARHDDPDGALLRALWPELGRGRGLCCGLGGILQITDPGLSARLGTACHAGLDGETVLSGCGGCVMQLAATAPKGRRVLHWLDVVTASYHVPFKPSF